MIDLEKTKELAKVSGINLTQEETEQFSADMTDIAELMDKIKLFDKKVEFTDKNAMDYENLRADIPAPSYEKEDILKNSKTKFEIPKII